MCTQASSSLGRVKEKEKGKEKEKEMEKEKEKEKEQKKEIEIEKEKKKKKKLERPNPDFRVHQSPRGPGASPFFLRYGEGNHSNTVGKDLI